MTSSRRNVKIPAGNFVPGREPEGGNYYTIYVNIVRNGRMSLRLSPGATGQPNTQPTNNPDSAVQFFELHNTWVDSGDLRATIYKSRRVKGKRNLETHPCFEGRTYLLYAFKDVET